MRPSNTATTTNEITSEIVSSTNIVITIKSVPRLTYVDDSTKYSGFSSVTVYYDSYSWQIQVMIQRQP